MCLAHSLFPNFEFSPLNKHYGDLLTHSIYLHLGSLRTKNSATKKGQTNNESYLHTQVVLSHTYSYVC